MCQICLNKQTFFLYTKNIYFVVIVKLKTKNKFSEKKKKRKQYA